MVKPTVSINGLGANDDPSLESQASRLGSAALRPTPSMDPLGETSLTTSPETPSDPPVLQRQVDTFQETTETYDPPAQDLKKSLDYSYFTTPMATAKAAIDKSLVDPKKTATDVPTKILAILDYGGSPPSRQTHKSGVVGKIGIDEFLLRSGGTFEVFEGGHLIPHELWDEDDSDVDKADDYVNLVPMSRTMNVGARNAWRVIESRMVELVANLTGNDVLAVQIDIGRQAYDLTYEAIANNFNLAGAPGKNKNDTVRLYGWIPLSMTAKGEEGEKKKKVVLKKTVVENELHSFALISTSKQLVQTLQRTPIWGRMSPSMQTKVGKLK
jgi:hypothetical protein